METEDLVRQWRTAVRISHRAHADAAARNQRTHLFLGVPALVLASVVGTTIIATMEASPGRTAKAVGGLAAIAVAVLVALETFLGHHERAHRHHEAAMRYSQIQRELDEILLMPDPAAKLKKHMEELRARWSEIDLLAPGLSARQQNRARDLVLGTSKK